MMGNIAPSIAMVENAKELQHDVAPTMPISQLGYMATNLNNPPSPKATSTMRKTFLFSSIAALLCLSMPALADEKPVEKERSFQPGVLVGLGLPSPLSIAGSVKYKRLLSLNLELGFLPAIDVSDLTIHQEMFDASVRVFPFRGAFFLGFGVGEQRLTASTQQTFAGVSGTERVSVSTTFLSPRLGFIKRWDFGLAIGMDVGVELPIAGETTNNISTSQPLPPGTALSTGKATDFADRIKTTPIPIVHLLQLGYIF